MRTTVGGLWDGYVARISADGASLLASTLLGGDGPDQARGLAVDCECIEVGAAALAEAIDAWARGTWIGRHAPPRGLAEEFRNDRLAAVWAGRMAEVSELPVWCPRPEPVAAVRASAVLEGAG